jgi:hypothetical protein
MKKTLINLGLTAGAVYVLYRLFKKDDVIPMNRHLPVDGASGFDGSLQEIINEGKRRKIMGRKQKGFRTEGLNFSAGDFSFQGAGDF